MMKKRIKFLSLMILKTLLLKMKLNWKCFNS